MSTIVTRADKGAELTHSEVDANFTNLNTDKLEASLVSVFGLSLVGDADATAARATLGLGSAATASSGAFASAVHGHSISDVSGLQSALDSKQGAGSYAASSHTHTAADITDFAEASQDVIGAMVTAAGGSYDDSAGTIVLPSGGGNIEGGNASSIGTINIDGGFA